MNRIDFSNIMRQRRHHKDRRPKRPVAAAVAGTPRSGCVLDNLYGSTLRSEQRFEFAAAIEDAGGSWLMFVPPGSASILLLSTINTCPGLPECQSDHRQGGRDYLALLQELLGAGFSVKRMRYSRDWPLPELYAAAKAG